MRFFFTFWLLGLLLSTNAQVSQQVLADQSFDIVNQDNYRQYFNFELSLNEFKNQLISSPSRNNDKSTWAIVKLPMPDGTYRDVRIAEASVFSQKMQARYPEIKTYVVSSVDECYVSGRLSVTPLGLNGLIITDDGDVFFEPVEGDTHIVYHPDRNNENEFTCNTDHSNVTKKNQNTSRDSYGGEMRELIIAIASSGEFSAKHSNNLTTINSFIATYLAELNVIYERDAGVTFTLTEDNDDIVFFNPNTDGLDPSNNSAKLNSAQSVISGAIPAADYDVGHVFYEIDYSGNGYTGSGIAGLGVTCSNSFKARGWSGCGGNYPTWFWMDIFAHEVGHQLGATHCYYGTSANCGFGNRSVGDGVEPGSGNSLMSYEKNCFSYGSCTDQNITPYAGFNYLHGYSIDQIQDYLSTESCYAISSISNSAPVISMPSNFTIPKGTPFVLSATATDADGDALLLGWEEIDTDNLNLSCPGGAPNDAATSTTAPLFRSFDPASDGGTRYFPQMSDILGNTQTMGEILPQVGRDIDVRFTARAESFGGVSYEDMTVTVDGNSGPFEVLTGNGSSTYTSCTNLNIQWTVAGTNNSPVNCTGVNILFSFDGGATFPQVLASNTPNDGSQVVELPSSGTTNGRIKIEGNNNIFFDISNEDITISSTCNAIATTISNDEPVVADPGSPDLVLDLSLGDAISNFNGTLVVSDPNTNLIGRNMTTGGCVTFGNNPKYQTIVVQASETDDYSFSTSASFSEVLNIYSNSFNPGNPCSTWAGSNMQWDPVSTQITFDNPYTMNIAQGEIVEIVLSGFSSSNVGAYSVGISSGGTGELINGTAVPSGYTYLYTISNSQGNIEDIAAVADLSDDTQYTSGEYIVEGFMVQGSPNLSSYIGGPLITLKSNVENCGGLCGQFSTNQVSITINGCTPSTKMVTSSADDGTSGTLGYEIENACEGDIIEFSPSLVGSTITLTSEIVVAFDLEMSGLGKNSLTISGGSNNRIFNVNQGVSMSISDVALEDGYALTEGGAFINHGTVTLDNVKFEGNMSGASAQAFSNQGIIIVEAGVVEVKN